jgi:hypothetical protein
MGVYLKELCDQFSTSSCPLVPILAVRVKVETLLNMLIQ